MTDRATIRACAEAPAGTPLPVWTGEPAYFPDAYHRAWLRRRLAGGGPPLGFILHNPSTAGVDLDDPTSKRGIGFADAMGASDLIFVNAATGIATDADKLVEMDDPIGPMADEAIAAACEFVWSRGGIMVAAWGAPKGKSKTRYIMQRRFSEIVARVRPLYALRITKSGHPEHPLYLPATLRPVMWRDVVTP